MQWNPIPSSSVLQLYDMWWPERPLMIWPKWMQWNPISPSSVLHYKMWWPEWPSGSCWTPYKTSFLSIPRCRWLESSMFGKARSRIIIVDQKNLEMEKVAVLVVEAEITRDDNNHTLLPVLKDVAHLCKVLHHTSIHMNNHLFPKGNTVIKEVRQVRPQVRFWWGEESQILWQNSPSSSCSSSGFW